LTQRIAGRVSRCSSVVAGLCVGAHGTGTQRAAPAVGCRPTGRGRGRAALGVMPARTVAARSSRACAATAAAWMSYTCSSMCAGMMMRLPTACRAPGGGSVTTMGRGTPDGSRGDARPPPRGGRLPSSHSCWGMERGGAGTRSTGMVHRAGIRKGAPGCGRHRPAVTRWGTSAGGAWADWAARVVPVRRLVVARVGTRTSPAEMYRITAMRPEPEVAAVAWGWVPPKNATGDSLASQGTPLINSSPPVHPSPKHTAIDGMSSRLPASTLHRAVEVDVDRRRVDHSRRR